MNFLQIESLKLLCLNFNMSTKGFTETQYNVETPNDVSSSEKPLNKHQISSGRVDINVLKSKLQKTESKEFKKNLIILSLLISALAGLGIYLSI